ncbi:hypothetical protein OJAV_G00233650 [Oryzias javanicus]|uniref:Protein arginine methyltransferase NDUFAF7 n=1 Tax=Oryzias javanicus TaxID=123683 RepID=A0A437C1F9_ORYJA|nr:hypothetical protein OJAV_G00233650 [Oryzias javanicus]
MLTAPTSRFRSFQSDPETMFCVRVRAQLLLHRAFSPSAVPRWTAGSRAPCSSSADSQDPGPSMLKHLTSKIKATGPITVAEYMKEVLTNPVTGYYVRGDMLGPDGDFITSPEISQIFGELIGVWIISEWMGAGPTPAAAAGGAGTWKRIPGCRHPQSFQSVEAQRLTGSQEWPSSDGPVYLRGETPAGLPVSWYRRLEDVPSGFSIFVAHEFFDALPVHKFQRTDRGWREVMVDIDPREPQQLRFVLAPSLTLASSVLVQAGERRDHLEVCAEAGVIVQQLARRISENGGAALIADYGHDGTKTDTLRSFKNHQLHHVLSSPGSADLTADVDFSYIRRMAGESVTCLGPVTQKTFLKNMGVDVRMQVLLRNCSDPSTRKQLISSYDMLTSPTKMGERFHFFSLLHPSRFSKPVISTGLNLDRTKSPASLPVAGFTELSCPQEVQKS